MHVAECEGHVCAAERLSRCLMQLLPSRVADLLTFPLNPQLLQAVMENLPAASTMLILRLFALLTLTAAGGDGEGAGGQATKLYSPLACCAFLSTHRMCTAINCLQAVMEKVRADKLLSFTRLLHAVLSFPLTVFALII